MSALTGAGERVREREGAPRAAAGPAPPRRGPTAVGPARGSRAGAVVLPLAILVALVGLVLLWNPGELLVRDDAPPVEDINFGRTVLKPGLIELSITNQGQDALTIAQVLVDEAYWVHDVHPDRTLGRLDRATVVIPYPWVEGEAHVVVLLTSLGTPFEHEIPLALETPATNAGTLGVYALIGLLVGVLPIFAGLAWYPAIARAGPRVEFGILAFTIGLLAFLVVESLDEALELAGEAPAPLAGPGLVLLAVAVAIAVLFLVGHTLARGAEPGSQRSRLVAAYLIAIGIGLHNLGEGLAIGAAYALGEVALGAFLVLGFTLHNVTEGPAIVAPLARMRAKLAHLAAFGLIAGGPTILGTFIGGLAFSPLLGAIFFALGAGAMLQVILAVGAEMRAEPDLRRHQAVLAVGLVAGIALMWATGLLT